MEPKSLCHGSGKVSSELTDLSLTVPEIGATRAATHFFDDIVVTTREFEPHGAAANSVLLEHLFHRADGVFAFLLDAVQLRKAVPTFLSPNLELPERWSQPGQFPSLATDRHSPYIVLP
jgi:hypothetical protein